MSKKTIFLSLLLVFVQFFTAIHSNATDLQLTGSIDGYYYSTEDIYTDGTTVVEDDSAAVLSTFNTVTLNPGFHVELGGTLSINQEDTDSDGLLDSWETEYFGDLDEGASSDTDNDGSTNIVEFNIYTNPSDSDTDDDGMPDGWEAQYGLNPLTNDASGDPDNDSLSNLAEYQNSTYPNDSDTDNDGMPDGWEVQYGLNPLTNDASSDLDNDSLSNLAEYQNSTYPNDSDTDNDGMPDGWEVQYSLNPLSNDASSDPDNDSLSNLGEYQNSTDPNDSDSDDDAMPDGWEVQYSLNPLSNDASGDPDNDNLSNLEEYQNGTNPNDSDTDDDEMPDDWEVQYGLNPLTNDASNDPDNDGLSNFVEYQNGTNPNDSDSDNDGMPDGWELQNGFDPLTDDASGDPDNDNLTNLEEYQNGTNPNGSDTDDDGMPDGWEVQYGLNPLTNDASSDPDNDGFTNYQEYTMGTDPTDPDYDLYAQDDMDFGIAYDEQQGGGGLVGETIRILNGNVIEARSDISFSSPNQLGLILEGFYNSRSANSGAMGYGWTHTYEATLDPSFVIGSLEFLKIIDGTGRAHYFLEESAGLYEGIFAEKTYVEFESDEYVWYLLDGSEYGFSSTGQLIWMDDAQGNSLVLAYDASNLLDTVTDSSSGRVLTFNYDSNDMIEYVSGPVTTAVSDGIWATYGYDSYNNLTSVTYADGSGFNYAYEDTNDIHNLTEKTNKADHLINTWDYDTSDRAISNFSRDGMGVDIVYTSDSQIDVTDAYDKEREYTIIEAADRTRVSAITDGAGGAGSFPYSDSNIVSWVYDDNMNPEELEYPGGTIDQYSDFDERGNPGTVKLALGEDEERVIYYTYHPYMNTPLTRTEASVLSSGDKVTIWDYDDDDDTTPNEDPTALVSRIIEQGYTNDEYGTTVSYEYITTYTYNGKGQVLSIDGPLSGTGDTTSLTYDATTGTGDLLSIIRPLIGATEISNYDAAGQAGTVTDVNGNSQTYTYDGRGRVVSIYNSADSSTSSTDYDLAGNPELKTDEDGVETEFEYDTTYGRLLRRYDHELNYIEYGYDDQGNMTDKDYYDSSDTLSNSKDYLYEGASLPGLLYRETDGNGNYTQYEYDLDGNVSSVTDPNGNATSYAYDPMSRLITVTQPGSIVTTYTYDAHGNLHTVTAAEGNTTTYTYDDMARLVSVESPDTGTTTYAYDETGNPINKTDANTISVDYAYDVLNRLTDIDFPTDTDITYSYDSGTNGMGQRTGMVDESGSYTFSYDGRGRLTGKSSIIESVTYDLTRTYTVGGRVSSITYPSGRTINYYRTTCACSVDSIDTTYDSTTTTLMEDLTYRPFGGASAMENGAEGTIGSTYDTAGRLTVSNPGATHERTYTYDDNGNLLTITSASTPYYNRVYTYDSLNRLTSATAENAWGEIDYTYDDVGNRLTKVTDDASDSYAYTTGTNLLCSITGTETTSYTYDDNGNITGMGDKTLTYNEDNRLVSVVENSETLGEYTYNGLGQRIIKEVDGTTTVFLYDFDGNIIGESDETGDFSKEYLYRGSNRLAMVDVPTEEVYYYGNDQLGTPEILTDSTNTVVWEAIYKPFGEAEVNTHSTVVNNFRFPGQYYDSETGLHYNYHRYYDPSTGRYLTPDPIGIERGTNHLYVYVENNPINFMDPEGKGLIGAFKCYYYTKKMAEYLDKCGDELECMRKCYGYEGDIKFMFKYDSQWISEALIKCAAATCPDKKLVEKWAKNCMNAALTTPSGKIPTKR